MRHPSIKRKQSGKSDDPHAQSCCLCWTVSDLDQTEMEDKVLLDLHREIAKCVEMFGAEIILEDAVSGFIRGYDVDEAGMTAADTMARVGQLLCRWAVNNSVNLRVGVEIGKLRQLIIPGTTQSQPKSYFFGAACTGAKRLVVEAEQDNMVHMSTKTKNSLSALEHLTLISSLKYETYYLDDTVVNIDDIPDTIQARDALKTGTQKNALLSLAMELVPKAPTGSKMSFDEFCAMLKQYKVPVQKYGKAHAKTLQEFYQSDVVEEKAYISKKGDDIERTVAMLKISLRAQDEGGKKREMRLASKGECDSGKHKRQHKFAMIVKLSENETWQQVVEKCLTAKFGLSAAEQKSHVDVDVKSHRVSETRNESETMPGITTNYMIHSVVVNVTGKDSKPLEKIGLPGPLERIGLPGFSDFSQAEVEGGAKRHWTWVPVGDHPEDTFMSMLQVSGIDPADFSVFAFDELYDEVNEKKMSTLEVRGQELMRTITIIKIWLHADIFNVDHVLSLKSKFEKGVQDESVSGNAISMRMKNDTDLASAFESCLFQMIGITPEFQEKKLSIDQHRIFEEIAYSKSYPGLKTLYLVNEFHARVTDSWTMKGIGLPAGTDCSFMSSQSLSSGATDTVITHWGWVMNDRLQKSTARSSSTAAACRSITDVNKEAHPSKSEPKRRAPCPETWVLSKNRGTGLVLEEAMKGRKTDWDCARRAASKIRDPSYSCKNFHDDVVAAFPELALYCVAAEGEAPATTAGRTADDEYQRTMGALFAVYWLMRLDIDGKESFCFGLDADWQPRGANETRVSDFEKRKAFYTSLDWDRLEKLVISAGLLREGGKSHDAERTLAMLVLMSIHDIMKLEMLLPSVDATVGTFCGYETGNIIADHDVALSYVMAHRPVALPSYNGLKKELKDAVKFTHSKMDYNMGWLVQGEAPPSALFKTFREVVISGNAPARDVAFYFVHWFTDLAGAEPVPMEGCEKMVLKFPLKVLMRFIDSFAIVQNLSPAKTETQVLEEYLQWRWECHEPVLGPVPSGHGAVAKMRLVLMAQGDSEYFVKCADGLSTDDASVLFQEMALTGCKDQSYACERLVNADARGKGPAVLVYYGPALLQKAGKKDPKGCLMILAEVYRQARTMWPLTAEDADLTVTVRIDAMKELDVAALRQPNPGYSFVIVRNSPMDAAVRLLAASELKDCGTDQAQVLDFNPVKKPPASLPLSKSPARKAGKGSMLKNSVR